MKLEYEQKLEVFKEFLLEEIEVLEEELQEVSVLDMANMNEASREDISRVLMNLFILRELKPFYIINKKS